MPEIRPTMKGVERVLPMAGSALGRMEDPARRMQSSPFIWLRCLMHRTVAGTSPGMVGRLVSRYEAQTPAGSHEFFEVRSRPIPDIGTLTNHYLNYDTCLLITHYVTKKVEKQ